MKTFDLRSDTVTKPSEGMKKAMYRAEVGDDVYGEDPTINRLKDQAAEITGKKAALFVPSGSMGNLIPLYLLGGRGNEILAHKNSHILHYEMASVSALAGILPVGVEGSRGILKPENLALHIRPQVYYMPRATLIEIENTHNREGGTCYSLNDLKAVKEFAVQHGMYVHMDGARVFNAAAAVNLPVKRIASFTDTLTFCLSKGLGAPVGSLLCGSKEFIAEARRVRKLLGGGMRQAGILAAAGIYALENNVERLVTDHEHAKVIANALRDTNWADIDPESVETNIVIFTTPNHPAERMVSALKRRGILCGASGGDKIRMVTHLEISRDDITQICDIIGGTVIR